MRTRQPDARSAPGGRLARPLLRGMWREVLDLAFPQRCIACGRWGASLHEACLDGLPRAEGPRCTVCWRPGPGTWCERCAAGDMPAFDALRAPFRFEGDVRRALLEAKFRGVTSLLEPLAGAAAALVPPEWRVEAVTAVPLWPSRERRRGFNQAAIAARAVAEALDVPVHLEVLRRVRETPPQASLDAARRHRNLDRAFAARGPLPSRILVVDDVTTTGATLGAAAAALRTAGAARVYALALARED